MHGNGHTRQLVLLALCLCVATAGLAPATVGADHDDESAASEIVAAATDEGSVVRTALAYAGGLADRVLTFGTPDTDASTACDDLRSTIDDNSTTLQDYANDRVDAAESADVLEIECVIDGETATTYVTADVVNGSDYENASAVGATNRSVDESCTLRDDAAANAADELDHFVGEYIGANETIPRSEYARLAGRYSDQVACSFDLKE